MDTAGETAKLAGECAIIRRAVALARWVGPEGEALTRVGVLRKPAVPGACATIGIRLPERFRSAADIPGLHRPWTVALAIGVLEIIGDRAAASPELDGWPGEGDRGGRWLDALRAVCGEITGGAADDSLGLLVLALALLRSLSAGIRLSSREVIDAAHAIADDRGLGLMQVHVLGGMSALSRGFLTDEVGSLLGLLAEFGAVTAGKEPAVTALGEWAMERLEADLPRGISPGATATEAITVVAVARASDRWHMARGWLCARKPADAVRELLAAADPLLAWLRDAAATMAAITGEDGLPGWHAIAGNATAWPSSARLARAELHDWGRAAEPSPSDRGWLGAEAAAAALLARGEAWPEGQGADEALCRLWATAGGGPLDIGALLAMACAAGHQEAGAVAAAVAALAESGAALTAAQAVDLKVTLWRSSPRCGALSACPLRRPSATCTVRSRSCSPGTAITCTPSPLRTCATAIRSSTWRKLPARRRSASVTLSRPAPASQSGTSTTSAPAGSTRSPARAHPALLRKRPSPGACPSAGIIPSSTGTRMRPPARGPSTWPRSTPRWRADPHAC